MGKRFNSGTGSILINRSGARISIDDGTNSFVTANYDSLCKILVQLIRDNSGLSEAGHGNPSARVGDVIGAEKATMLSQLDRWFGELGIPIILLRGYGSHTYLANIRDHV